MGGAGWVDPDVFRNASPIARVRTDAPPFLVVHGSADTVIPVERVERRSGAASVAYTSRCGASSRRSTATSPARLMST